MRWWVAGLFIVCLVLPQGRSSAGADLQLALSIVDQRDYAIFFDRGSAELTSDARLIIGAVAADALAIETTHVEVVGYVDRAEAVAQDHDLAARRARVSQAALVAAGVPLDMTSVRTASEADLAALVAESSDEAQWRRADIIRIP